MSINRESITGGSENEPIGGSWVQRSFMMNNTDSTLGTTEEALFGRYFTTAIAKYTDTTPGGNLSINPIFQASRWTDPPPIHPGTSESEYQNSSRQGGFYSEMYDDSQQVIYLRFGVPVFNSLTSFYSRFYSPSYAKLVRTGGTYDSVAQKLGAAAGAIVFSPLRLISGGLNIVKGIAGVMEGLRTLLGKNKSSQYYYIKPTMFLYWSAAQNILNHIAVNKGLIGLELHGNENINYEGIDPVELTGPGTEREYIKEMYGDILTSSGQFNLYSMATRGQRRANAYLKWLRDTGEHVSVQEAARDLYQGAVLKQLSKADETRPTLERMGQMWFGKRGIGSYQDVDKEAWTDDDASGDTLASESVSENLWDIVTAAQDDGAEFVGFRVNTTGGVTESFRNSFRQSDVSEWINSTSSSSRSAKFNIANGAVMDNSIVKAIGGFVSKGIDAVSEVAESLGLGGIGALTGNAQVEIPKFWDKSDTSFPSKSYTIDLHSPYGDAYSQIINIYAPLSLLLAGALARSTGRHSYTEPFYCQVFDKGRAQTRLGMISNLSISRGSNGNVAWSTDQEPLTIKVTMEIEDMESNMHMPLVEHQGTGIGTLAATLVKNTATELVEKTFGSNAAAASANVFEGGWFSEDTSFTDYMAVLGSLDLKNQIYNMTKAKRRWRLNAISTEVGRTKSAYGLAITSNTVAQAARIFYQGILH